VIRAFSDRLLALRGGRFIAPLLTLLTGVAAAQAFVFAARPVLTRLFTPDEFGVLTLFVTLLTPLAVAAGGRYEDAVMLPPDERQATNLFMVAMLTVALTTALLTLLMLGRTTWATLLNSPEIRPALAILPLTMALVTVGHLLETWHARFDRFHLVSIGRGTQSGVVVTTQIVAGLLGASAMGLVLGTVAGFAVVVLVLTPSLVVRDRALFRRTVTRHRMRVLAWRYRRFPSFSAPAALLNMLSTRVVIPLLSVFFGATSVGLYGVAFGTLALPVGVVTGAVGQVFFVRGAEALRAGTLGPLTEQVFRRLVAVALFPMAAAMVAGPALFGFVFGDVWTEAGVYARFLAPWLFVSALATPLTRVFDVRERQRADLGFSIFLVAVQVVTLTLAGTTGEVRTTVAAVAVAGTLSRALQVGWLLRLAGATFRRTAGDLVRLGGLALPFLGVIALAQAAQVSGLVLLGVTLGCGLGFLGAAAWLDRRLRIPFDP